MNLMTLLPFMDQEDLTELVQKIKSKEITGVNLMHLYPFLGESEIDELVDELVEQGNRKHLYGALPFMTEARLNKLYEEVKAGKVENFKEEALLPFLGRDKIKDMVNDLIKNKLGQKLEGLDEEISSKVEKAINDAIDE